MGGVTITRYRSECRVFFESAEVAIVAGTRPEMMVVISRDEPQRRCDCGIGCAGMQSRNELGECRRRILRSGESQFEEIPQHYEFRWVLTGLPERAEALAQCCEKRRGGRRVDAVPVGGHVRQHAIERTQM
jgi:hypothetical protein